MDKTEIYNNFVEIVARALLAKEREVKANFRLSPSDEPTDTDDWLDHYNGTPVATYPDLKINVFRNQVNYVVSDLMFTVSKYE